MSTVLGKITRVDRADRGARYPIVLQVMHWTLALLVSLQVALILVLGQLQSVDYAKLVLELHRDCGGAIGLIVLARLILGFRVKPPKAHRRLPRWQIVASHAAHWAIYAVLLAQPIMGALYAWSRGDEVAILGLIRIPQLYTPTDDQALLLKLGHRWIAYTFIGLIGIHLAAVIFNPLVRKVSVMARITPAPPSDRLTNRIPLSMQLCICCGTILFLSTAAGLYGANQYKAFSDYRDRFDETEVSVLDDMRTAQIGLKSLVPALAEGVDIAAFKARTDKLAIDLTSIREHLADAETRTAVVKTEAALKDAMAIRPAMASLNHVDEVFQAAVDDQTNVVLQGRLKMREFAANGHDLIVLVLAPAVISGALLAFLLSRSVLNALNRARRVVQGVEAGAASEDIDVEGYGEFAQLMRDVIRMRNTVEERQREAHDEQMRQQAAIQEERLAKEAAETANRAKSDFLAIMSHEIRTPMNGVLGMVQAMEHDELPPHQRERLQIVRQSGEALLTILNDILDISKIEAGKMDLESIDFDLEQLILVVYSNFKDVAAKKDVNFFVEMDEAAHGQFRGDPVRLRQILSNLVSNAVKFTTEGEVGVEIGRTGDLLRFVVTDTGVGIPQDSIDKLFSKFTQADTSTTRKFGGTGLGLAICRELAEAMDGRVWVESEVGVGSRFILEVSLERTGEGGAIDHGHDDADFSDRPLKILAAEDNQVNQLVLRTLLGQAGLEPTIVDNGQLAVEAWEREDWDLILMDVQMPVLDGPDATRAIRARERETGRVSIPILALTANAMTHQSESYRAAGMNGVVAKPIQIDQLFNAIAAATSAMGEQPDAAVAA